MNPKKLQNLRQANYMQLRKLCEADTEGPPEPVSEAAAKDYETLLRLIQTMLDCNARGVLSAEATVHAIRELTRE